MNGEAREKRRWQDHEQGQQRGKEGGSSMNMEATGKEEGGKDKKMEATAEIRSKRKRGRKQLGKCGSNG